VRDFGEHALDPRQPREHALAAEQREDIEQAEADRFAGDREANRMDDCTQSETARGDEFGEQPLDGGSVEGGLWRKGSDRSAQGGKEIAPPATDRIRLSNAFVS
jgi:hypothetical protein